MTGGKISVILLCTFTAWALGAGDAPGVSVRFREGRLLEVLTNVPPGPGYAELRPGLPFATPLPEATLEQFRAFYERVCPTLDVTARELARIHELRSEDEGIAALAQQLVRDADQWLGRPVPSHTRGTRDVATPPALMDRIQTGAYALADARRACALAFALTGQERYAQKAWEAMAAHIGHFYTYGTVRGVQPWQSPRAAAEELYEAAAAYDLLAHWEGLHPLDHALVFTYLRRLGTRVEYAVEHSDVIGNEQAIWTTNLGCLALYGPDLPEASRWLRIAHRRLPNVMADFMTDGGHIECAPDIHAFALAHVLRYARLAARKGHPDLMKRQWGPTQVSIEKAVDWLTKIATPLGETPAINDALRTPLAGQPWFYDAAATYNRPDWLHAGRIAAGAPRLFGPVPEGLQPRPPQDASVLLPDTGFAVMRDGWGPDDAYLLLDYGRHGGGHGHLDKLSFVLYADGQPWVLDAGRAPDPTGHPTEQETWHRSTPAHNTVLVDQSSQRPVDGKLALWDTRPEFDIAAAQHDGYPGILHRRTVFHPRSGYFLIFDELENRTARAHDLRWLAHVHGRRESGTMRRILFWREGGFGLKVLPARQRGLRGVAIDRGLCTGCDGVSASVPTPLGAALAPGDPGWGYIPYIGLKKTLAPRATQTYGVLLMPFYNQEPEATIAVSGEELAYGVQVTMGSVSDKLLIRKMSSSAGMAQALDVKTPDGTYAFVREQPGKLTYFATDGDTLSLPEPGD